MGRKRVYDFKGLKVGQIRQYTGTNCSDIQNCAKFYCDSEGHNWQFKCFTTGEKPNLITNLIRIK